MPATSEMITDCRGCHKPIYVPLNGYCIECSKARKVENRIFILLAGVLMFGAFLAWGSQLGK